MSTTADIDWSRWAGSGKRIYVGGGACYPSALAQSLGTRLGDFTDLEFGHASAPGPAAWLTRKATNEPHIFAYPTFPQARELAEEGRLAPIPVAPSGWPALLGEGSWVPDVALLMLSPADRWGYCSLGVSVDYNLAAARTAGVIVAQINPRLPVTIGESHLPAARLSAFVEIEEELPDWPLPPVDEIHRRVARMTAGWIEDAATLRIPLGPFGEALCDALARHARLGVHGDILTDGIRRLFLVGVIDNSQKSDPAGTITVSQALGSGQLYAFCHCNPHLNFRPVDKISHPAVLARQKKLTVLVTPPRVCLTGAVSHHPEDPSQGDFLTGARLAEKGLSIALLAATNAEGSVSRLTLESPEPPPPTATVDAVATEYGLAWLRGKSVSERVAALVEIAHPDFREALMARARQWRLIPAFWSLDKPYDERRGAFADRWIRLKDGASHRLRLLHASDAWALQTFFYSHNEDTIHRRYGFGLKRMTLERALELTGVDQNRELALGIFSSAAGVETLHGVGRYYLDRGGRSAEMAFVTRESKRRMGVARAFLVAMIETGRARGLHFLWAQVDRDNTPMLRLFQLFGAKAGLADDGSSLKIRLPLQEGAEMPLPQYSVLSPPASGRESVE